MFYAENITVGSDGSVQFVDINAYENIDNENQKARYVRNAGNMLSRGIIRAAIFIDRVRPQPVGR